MTVSSTMNVMARNSFVGRFGPGGLFYINTKYLTPSSEKCESNDKRRPQVPQHSDSNLPLPLLPSLHAGLKRWRRNGSPIITPSTNHTSERLQYLAINALELSAPASDLLLTSRGAHWFQVSGHPDSLAPAGPGTVWKRRCGPEEAERRAYEALSACPHMRAAIPTYYREVCYKGDNFIELQDLLFGFQDPHVIDVKMGTRTFLESEVSKTTARSDLYEKMIAVNPEAPTESEHKAKAVTKLRYMQFREQQSSTNSEGFRIEGIKVPGTPPIKDLKKVKTQSQVVETMSKFFGGRTHIRQKMLKRVKEIRTMFENCEFFKTHEVIGSSIFMIFDENSVGAWLIDFAKTNTVPTGIRVTHRAPWKQGNYEEGFLYGLDRLISILENPDLDYPSVENIAPIVER